MAILVPSLTTPQGDVVTNVYAKVMSSDYSNRGADDPVLTGTVHFFRNKAASDGGLPPYTGEGFNLSPWAPGAARGTITCVGLASYVDGDSFTLNDGVNPEVEFAFDTADLITETSTLRRIPLSANPSADTNQAAEHIASIIRSTPRDAFFLRVVKVEGAVISLINAYAKAAGNVAQEESVADSGFLVTAMSGGADLIDIGAEVENHLLTLPMFAGGTRV